MKIFNDASERIFAGNNKANRKHGQAEMGLDQIMNEKG